MDSDLKSFFSACASSNQFAAKSLLVANPALLNTPEPRLHLTALFRECLSSNVSLVKFLLAQGADTSIANSEGETPLHHATDNSEYEIAELLLQHRTNINSVTKCGDTPLHNATFRGDYHMTAVLLRAGAALNIQSLSTQKAPLHIAVEGGHLECAKLLLRYGGDVYLKDGAGKTPADYMKEQDLKTFFMNEEALNRYLETVCDRVTDEDAASPLAPHEFKRGPTTDEPDSEADMLRGELAEFLGEIQCLGYCEVLARAGYGKVQHLVERMKGPAPLTMQELKAAGVCKVGCCVQILLKLDQLAGVLPEITINYPSNHKELTIKCCSRFLVASSFVTSLDGWLSLISQEDKLEAFNSAGYTDLESLFIQMYSRYPVTRALLSEIGISSTEDIECILSRLNEDCQFYVGRDLVPERAFSCSCLIL